MVEQTDSDDMLRREIHAFRAGLRTVQLATVSRDGVPEASYAPYVVDASGNYYVFISGLARHTRDLQDTGQVSLLFIEAEGAARNLFARRRLTCSCTATCIARDDPDWEVQLARFTQQFGKFIDTLRGLSDFRLFRLTPVSGGYVRGMGQAFRFEGPGFDAIRHVRGRQD
ncbi:MAG: pyridoxamine 5'-phosphate oxidase family protein [Gammaproteobacteria bacterium]